MNYAARHIPLQYKAGLPNDGGHNFVYTDNQIALFGLEGIESICFIRFIL
jgi:hypothetical protein